MEHGRNRIVIDGAFIACRVPAELFGAVEEFKLGGETVFTYFAVVGIEHGLDFSGDFLGFAFGEAGVGVGAGECQQGDEADEKYGIDL